MGLTGIDRKRMGVLARRVFLVLTRKSQQLTLFYMASLTTPWLPNQID